MVAVRWALLFRSALPRGERPAPGLVMRSMPAWFRSALPRGERLRVARGRRRRRGFRSALPRGERRLRSRKSYPVSRRFDPRSRAGSDGRGSAEAMLCARFDPRSRAGSDPPPPPPPEPPCSWFRSALPRGERRSARPGASSQESFDPRSRAGSDGTITIKATAIQSGFDPRSRAGSDAAARRAETRPSQVSIRAPARGATAARALIGASREVSIRAPARGATLRADCGPQISTSFDPRSRAGSDRSPKWCRPAAMCFDPRSRAGSDRISPPRSRFKCAVSIRAPARGATRFAIFGRGFGL